MTVGAGCHANSAQDRADREEHFVPSITSSLGKKSEGEGAEPGLQQGLPHYL